MLSIFPLNKQWKCGAADAPKVNRSAGKIQPEWMAANYIISTHTLALRLIPFMRNVVKWKLIKIEMETMSFSSHESSAESFRWKGNFFGELERRSISQCFHNFTCNQVTRAIAFVRHLKFRSDTYFAFQLGRGVSLFLRSTDSTRRSA